MNRLKYLILLSLLIPSLVLADSPQRNDVPTKLIGADLDVGQTYSVDQYGQIKTVVVGGGSGGLSQSVIPVSNSPIYGPGSMTGGLRFASVTDTIEAGSTTTVLNLTAHAVAVNDYIKYRGTGANAGVTVPVCSITTNTVTLCYALPATPGLDLIAIQKPVFYQATGSPTAANNAYALAVSIDSDYQTTNGPSLLKLEDVLAASGDAGVAPLGVVNSNAATLAAGELDYVNLALGNKGTVFPDLNSDFRQSTLRSPIKPEDEAVADTQSLMMMGAYRNDGLASISGADADAIHPSANVRGQLAVFLARTSTSGTNDFLAAEDSAFGDAETVGKIGIQAESALTSNVGTTGDLTPPKADMQGRLITTAAPRGEQVLGCNTAITTATTGQIVAAVASKVTAITSWDCTNTGAAATRVVLEDGDGTDLANGFLALTVGYFNQPFPGIPAYTQAVNKAIQVNVITAGASVICCARGYSTLP